MTDPLFKDEKNLSFISEDRNYLFRFGSYDDFLQLVDMLISVRNKSDNQPILSLPSVASV